MADLTSGPASGRASPGNDGTPSAGVPSTDPRAVRVRLAESSHTGSEPALRVAPAPEPLHMTNPTIGTGPLGGMSIAPELTPSPGVLAQRQPLVDGEPADVELRPLGGGRALLLEGGHTTRVIVEPDGPGERGGGAREVLVDGFRFVVEAEPERIASLRERASRGRGASARSGPLEVKAIIPGRVVAVSVEVGDTVAAGQQLLVVEAMKMQNELRAPRDGTIERVGVAVGVTIEIGDLLVVIS
jgi:biotin carboxyl carrier protein